MNNTPLISVIVPVYKVESYLDECVKSLINQTYTNLEIILVDDGSPDECPKMCDDWASKDLRIKVVHKENGGLSSARNSGLDIAIGEYVSFVDSDDFFDKRMYEKLYEGITRQPSIGVSAVKFLRYVDGKTSVFDSRWDIDRDIIVDSAEIGIKMLKLEVCFAATNKLYRRDLLSDVRFREGCLNEDTMFAFDLSNKMRKSKVDLINLNYNAYYYRMREGSLSHSQIPINVSYIENLQTIMEESDDERYKHEALLMYYRAVYAFNQKLLSDTSNKAILQREEYLDAYREKLKKIKYRDVTEGHISFRGFVVFLLVKHFPNVFSIIKRWR